MSISDVNKTLGIEPWDIYTLMEDGISVLIYNYRIKNRRMTIEGYPEDLEKIKHKEEAQTKGETWYTGASFRVSSCLKIER